MIKTYFGYMPLHTPTHWEGGGDFPQIFVQRNLLMAVENSGLIMLFFNYDVPSPSLALDICGSKLKHMINSFVCWLEKRS